MGGRANSAEVDGQTVELGASIVHAENALVSRLATEVGLEKEVPPSGHFAVYDGRTLVFRESNWWILNVLQLLWRYLFTGFSFCRWCRFCLFADSASSLILPLHLPPPLDLLAGTRGRCWRGSS